MMILHFFTTWLLFAGLNSGHAKKNHPQLACHRAQETSPRLGWEFAGPTTYFNQFGDDDSPKLTSAAAVQNVVGGANQTWFIGSVNGGVWRTRNLNARNNDKVHWKNVLDGQPVTCSSISALYASTYISRIFAGCGGSTSSEQGSDWNVVNSGDWGGIMVSDDNGDSWAMMEAFPTNYYVTDIVEISSKSILVAAQSHLFDRNDGGIWQSSNGGRSFTRIHTTPTFNLLKVPASGHVLATHARTAKHAISMYNGTAFEDFGQYLSWADGAVPFYTCAIILNDGRIVVAGLTRLPGGQPNNTDSQIFISSSSDLSKPWSRLQQPTRMDEDSMPKDRMALFADPDWEDLFYVAGNAGALAWRVNASKDTWTKLWDKPDVSDGSIPHGDCRNFAWDGKRLLLVTDGGIFARENPRQEGGRWISLNGDYSALELLSAHYDPHGERYVMGAQDNCAIVTKPNATAEDVGFGFVEGDGTVTAVDRNSKPSRLYGTTQFLGVGTIYSDPSVKKMNGNDYDDDNDDDCGGLCFAQGDAFIEVPMDKYFPEPSSFPFFVHPYALNEQDPTRLHFWVNGTGHSNSSGFYEFHIPHSVRGRDDIGPPRKILETPAGVMIVDFLSGGHYKGNPDPNLLLAISTTHLFVGRQNDPTTIMQVALPVSYASPVTLEYDTTNGESRILGPLTHAKTVFMAVAPTDSSIIAVTGWQSLDNLGEESIFLTTSSGRYGWRNMTGNLRAASGVSGTVRPGGMQLVELDASRTLALLVGTSSGIMITFVDLSEDTFLADGSKQHWVRLGTCEEFPIVLTADVDYEPMSDRLVAATFGRGIYVLKDAKHKLQEFLGQVQMHMQPDSTRTSNQ